MGAALAVNTIKAYDQAWSLWADWCAEAGRSPMPGTPDALCLFVSWALSTRGLRLASVRLSIAAIRYRCRQAGLESPVTDRVRRLMMSAARRLREKPGGRAALCVDDLARICRQPVTRSVEVRNRAILLVGFASGLRRSELVALDFADVKVVRQGVVLRLGVTKTDQVGAGRQLGIQPGANEATCPVRALKAWLKLRGDSPGALFTRITPGGTVSLHRLRGAVVSRVLKAALESVGVDSSGYAAHSLRAGFVTASSEAGASELAIMRRTGHRNVATVLKYVRPAKAFAVDPLAGVL